MHYIFLVNAPWMYRKVFSHSVQFIIIIGLWSSSYYHCLCVSEVLSSLNEKSVPQGSMHSKGQGRAWMWCGLGFQKPVLSTMFQCPSEEMINGLTCGTLKCVTEIYAKRPHCSSTESTMTQLSGALIVIFHSDCFTFFKIVYLCVWCGCWKLNSSTLEEKQVLNP